MQILKDPKYSESTVYTNLVVLKRVHYDKICCNCPNVLENIFNDTNNEFITEYR